MTFLPWISYFPLIAIFFVHPFFYSKIISTFIKKIYNFSLFILLFLHKGLFSCVTYNLCEIIIFYCVKEKPRDRELKVRNQNMKVIPFLSFFSPSPSFSFSLFSYSLSLFLFILILTITQRSFFYSIIRKNVKKEQWEFHEYQWSRNISGLKKHFLSLFLTPYYLLEQKKKNLRFYNLLTSIYTFIKKISIVKQFVLSKC